MRCVEVAVVRQVDDVPHRRRALRRVDLPQPAGVGALGQQRLQCFEDAAQIANERYIDADVLVDLRWIDLDVNLLRVLRVVGKVAGDAVVEAHAEGEQQIGFLNRMVYPRLAVHAHHAEMQRMRGREAAKAEQRRRNGNLLRLREGDHLLLRSRTA